LSGYALCHSLTTKRDARGKQVDQDPTIEQLADACMWLRHDFGLMDDNSQAAQIAKMRQYWRAIWKARNTPGRGAAFFQKIREDDGGEITGQRWADG
jgi:hypothetical protein